MAGGLILARLELMWICCLDFMYVSVSGLFVFDFWFVSSCRQTIISSNRNNITVARAPVAISAHERTLGIKAMHSKVTG